MKTVISFYLALLAVMAAGWVNNILWTFKQTAVTDLALGILGAVIAPVGAVHGLYLWF